MTTSHTFFSFSFFFFLLSLEVKKLIGVFRLIVAVAKLCFWKSEFFLFARLLVLDGRQMHAWDEVHADGMDVN